MNEIKVWMFLIVVGVVVRRSPLKIAGSAFEAHTVQSSHHKTAVVCFVFEKRKILFHFGQNAFVRNKCSYGVLQQRLECCTQMQMAAV